MKGLKLQLSRISGFSQMAGNGMQLGEVAEPELK
jgi:hypothetical protein